MWYRRPGNYSRTERKIERQTDRETDTENARPLLRKVKRKRKKTRKRRIWNTQQTIGRRRLGPGFGGTKDHQFGGQVETSANWGFPNILDQGSHFFLGIGRGLVDP